MSSRLPRIQPSLLIHLLLRRQNALKLSPSAECLRLLYNRRLYSCGSHCALHLHPSTVPERKRAVTKCSGVRFTYTFPRLKATLLISSSVKGRPHYYSYKKEEYAHIKFDLDTGTLYPLYTTRPATV